MKRLPVSGFGWMIRCELPQVLAIEAASFENPWGEEQFLSLLRQRNVIGMVGRRAKEVIAYAIYELERSGLHLLNFTVDPGLRRLDVGSQFIDRLKTKLGGRRDIIRLLIRETNLPAQLFFASQGFVASTVHRDYFADTGEDAYRMAFVHGFNPQAMAAVVSNPNRISRFLGEPT
jgi:ribosomal-protein-alanine N-acetyltransferase